MKYLQLSTTVRGAFVLLSSVALLSLAGCGGGGGGDDGGGATALTASAISAGSAHTCAIVEGKAAYCWGDNFNGQLGVGDDSVTDSNLPVAVVQTPADTAASTAAVLLDSGVAVISAGANHTCVIHNTAGEGETEVLAAKCWGRNANGQLGNDSTTESHIPVAVSTLDSGVSAISTGVSHTCAIHSGAAKCWGFNSAGQLGDSSEAEKTTPMQVMGLTSQVTAISTGGHTCAIHSGAAKCWGSNVNGKLGDGTTDNSNVPVAVVQTPADTATGTAAVLLDSGVSAISVGGAHTCAVHSGTAKCWGLNNLGQLGNSTTTNSPTPVDVTGLTSQVTAISAGNTHTCAVHSGTAKCWGENDAGQLGSGSTTASNVPVQVTGLTSQVTAISAGEAHTCAIHNGVAKCWGLNGSGRLGAGDGATSGFTPQTVHQPASLE